MFQQLIFNYGGYSRGYELITIKNYSGRLTFDYYVIPQKNCKLTFPHYQTTWARERSNSWLLRIENIHFEMWEDEYWADILDGVQWTLLYQYEGERERKVFGSNAYPVNWDQFRNLMTTLSHKLPRVEDARIEEMLRLW